MKKFRSISAPLAAALPLSLAACSNSAARNSTPAAKAKNFDVSDD